jgi:beta-xylosidase
MNNAPHLPPLSGCEMKRRWLLKRIAGMAFAGAADSFIHCADLSAAPVRRYTDNIPDPSPDCWGDQGNGTYRNPLIPADYSDIDVIRVGTDYYAYSSTFQFSPGVLILHSKDLVNWRILTHAIDDLTRIGPDFSWQRMNRYGHGVWAGSIRYHQGQFWIYFCTPNEGLFMTRTSDGNPEGPWMPVHCVWRASGWDDPCSFWDDDGQGYLVMSNFSDHYKIHLFKLSPDGRNILQGSGRVVHQSRGSEANKLYKINGYYYHLYSQVQGEGRVVMMDRSRHIDGPYETRQLNNVNARIDREPNQGGLVQIPSGKWYFLTQQGTGGHWDGRTLCLLPVTWIDGWPIIGRVGRDSIGDMVWAGRKPIGGFPLTHPQSSDDFNDSKLGVQWEWNYQPRMDKWSLTQRPGYLRLHAFKPLQRGNILKAGNTLTQRVMGVQRNIATIRMEINAMADGHRAGLCHFSARPGALGVVQERGARRLFYNAHNALTTGPQITGDTIWLRSEWNKRGISHFSYSVNGLDFQQFGSPYQLIWSFYRGDRLGIFSFNDDTDAGFVDIDWFTYTFSPQHG